ncbi:MAG: hypothetical protein RIQ53_4469 [Pseudomonadota bacterium]|jgi:4-hydroxy-2-oxoheptanedioate aldolase
MANPFKDALRRGESTIGLWLSLGDPYAAELCAATGFQWVLVDGEHGPHDLRSMLTTLQALAPYPAHPVVRVVQGETALLKQVLDIGAQTVLVPMVDTAAQAAELVRAVRYAPQGVRGVGAAVARAARWSTRTDYIEQANDETCLLVQAESVTALSNLEAICAVEGVDGVFIGPADLAASMGHRGHAGHPEVQAAIEQAITRIRAAGKAPGILTGDTTQARRYLALGAQFVAVGIDVLLLVDAARRLAGEFGVGHGPAAERQGGSY